MSRIKICKEENCHNATTTDGYCRLHYLRNWKRVKADKDRRAARKLNAYVEHIMKKHPDRYVDEIKENLRSKKFDMLVDEIFSEDEGDEFSIEDSSYDEDIEELLKKLKIEKGF